MSDFLFGVLTGATFALPGWLVGYAVATKSCWRREDELRHRLDALHDQRIAEAVANVR